MHRWGRGRAGRGLRPGPTGGRWGRRGGGGDRPPQRRTAGKSRERPGGVPASGLPGPRTPHAPRRPPLPRQEGWGCGWGQGPSLSVLGAAQRKNVHDPLPPPAPPHPLPPEPWRRWPSEPGSLCPARPLSVPGDPGHAPLGGGVKVQTVAPIGLGGLRGAVAPGCKALAEEAGGARWLPRNPPRRPSRAGRAPIATPGVPSLALRGHSDDWRWGSEIGGAAPWPLGVPGDKGWGQALKPLALAPPPQGLPGGGTPPSPRPALPRPGKVHFLQCVQRGSLPGAPSRAGVSIA